MSVILDLLVLLIIVLFIFLSAKKGFVRTLIEIVGFVLVILLANAISRPLADITYDKAVEPAIVKSVEGIASKDIAEVSDKVYHNVPSLLQNVLNEGNVYNNLKASLSENIDNGVETAVVNASKKVLKPVAASVLSMIFSILITIILLFVVGIIAKLVNKLFSFSFVGTANKVLGGVLGIVKGTGVASIVCTVLAVAVSLTGGFFIFKPDVIEKTFLFKMLIIG